MIGSSAARRTIGAGPAHRRLELPARLCRQGRQARGLSKENVPFQPKHWLKVSGAGIKPGDLVFVAGYPGRTQRHQTYAQVKETTE